jgi:hypothetical protein
VRRAPSPPKEGEIPVNLIRLEHHHHPGPPHRELRQKTAFDAEVRSIVQVANLSFDDDRNLRFPDVCMGGFGASESSITSSRSRT